MSNGKRVDCLLKFGSTNENIGIDSKFSWENYEKYKQETDENTKKALLKEYSRIIDSKSIAKKIKDLTKKKDFIKLEQLKKRTYPESGFNIKNRLIDTRLKITKLENTFGKQKADYLLKYSGDRALIKNYEGRLTFVSGIVSSHKIPSKKLKSKNNLIAD